jgi:hypothetical protein
VFGVWTQQEYKLLPVVAEKHNLEVIGLAVTPWLSRQINHDFTRDETQRIVESTFTDSAAEEV